MNERSLAAFLILIRREMWESKNLFIAAPLVLTILTLVVLLWTSLQLPADTMTDVLGQLAAATNGLGATTVAPFLMAIAIPFMIVLYICTLIYLINSLYQDRKDSSILFWQSMPVSNFSTVMSKIVTVCFIAPLFVVAAIGVLLAVLIILLLVLSANYDVQVMAFSQMIVAALYCLLLVYLTAVLAALWLFPTAGWFLLFSAFSKNLPFLWAIGVFILLLFVEDIIFGTQFLGNWLDSRTNNYNYIIIEASDFVQRLFTYDMLFGIALGSLLILGAVYMRRYAD
jgi:ABC-2 type transport system permease protein